MEMQTPTHAGSRAPPWLVGLCLSRLALRGLRDPIPRKESPPIKAWQAIGKTIRD